MGNYSHATGVTGTVTVPAGKRVRRYSCVAGTGGGTIIITPFNAGAQPTIIVPEGTPFGDPFSTDPQDSETELPAGSTIAFAGTTTYFVRFT